MSHIFLGGLLLTLVQSQPPADSRSDQSQPFAVRGADGDT